MIQKAGWLSSKTLIPLISDNGNIYSVPVNIHRANVLWYNPKILSDNGITVPTTMDEWFAAMDTLRAALLLPNLEIFPEELLARNRVASRYTELLSPCKALQTPSVPAGLCSAWAQYSILSDRRQHIQSVLKGKGIPTAVYYPRPLHLQTAYAGLGYREGDFPEAESASRRILSLPMHPYLEDRQIQRIAGEITAVLNS